MIPNYDRRVLMKSRMNCHVMGVHSIVLSEDRGRLKRLFICEEGHRLGENWEGNIVGIHNHRYDLIIKPLCGLVLNRFYIDCNRNVGLDYSKYRFDSSIKEGTFNVEWLGDATLKLANTYPLNEPHIMKAEQLHTMVAIGKAAWFVEESVTVLNHTILYTNVKPVCHPEMYKPFKNSDHVIKTLERFFK